MIKDLEIEAHIQKNDKAIEELSLRIETLNRDVEEFLKELSVTENQLSTFLNDQNNFSNENWATILQQRKALDEKLLKELVNVSNPLKTKKTYKERNVQRNWIFVR